VTTEPKINALSEDALKRCWSLFLEKSQGAATTRSDARGLWFHIVALRIAQHFPGRWNDARRLLQKWISNPDRRLPLLRSWEPQLAVPDPETILSHDFQPLRSVSPLAALLNPREHREALVFFQRHYGRED
jgi:hypothetical protein